MICTGIRFMASSPPHSDCAESTQQMLDRPSLLPTDFTDRVCPEYLLYFTYTLYSLYIMFKILTYELTGTTTGIATQ